MLNITYNKKGKYAVERLYKNKSTNQFTFEHLKRRYDYLRNVVEMANIVLDTLDYMERLTMAKRRRANVVMTIDIIYMIRESISIFDIDYLKPAIGYYMYNRLFAEDVESLKVTDMLIFHLKKAIEKSMENKNEDSNKIVESLLENERLAEEDKMQGGK